VRPFLATLALLAACSGRDPSGLGPHYERYLAARKQNKTEEAVRALYEAWLDALRSKDPARAMRFFRPDMQAESLNSVRMGLEFVKILVSMEGRITDLRDLVDRVTLKTSETAMFRFRNSTQSDRRDRTYQLTRLDGEWYFDPPDLGRARRPR
jgi:hypothetical protein